MFSKKKPVRLTGKKYTEFRRKVYERDVFCRSCGGDAPLYDRDGNFNLYDCGHVSHIVSRGAGGSDTMENVIWECYTCHIKTKHGLKFKGD
jgi:hypothetical protein